MMIFSNRNLTIIKENRKRAFTMVELVIVSIMIATGLIGIVVTINYGISFAERTKTNVVAINLAREGIEGVYNIRDTNRQRWGIKKEQCWLKIDPLNDPDGNGCQNDDWMGTNRNYVLQSNTTSGYNYLKYMGSTPLNIYDKIDANDNYYIMCQNAQNQWYNCPGSTNPYVKEGRFFREIRGIGLYDKETGNVLSCDNGSDVIDCGTESAKEYRFCSTVQYQAGGIGQVELCGVLTNFLN